MKTRNLLSVLIISLTLGGCTSSSNTEVPAPIKAKFASLYPNISVGRWEKEGNNYEASYKDGNLKKTIVMDAQGQPLQTETRIDVATLSPTIVSYIHTNYSSYKINEVSSIVATSGVQTYEVEVKDGDKEYDLTFDQNGKFLSKEADTD